MAKKYEISEVYPNSPLVEVVCEIRFPGELVVECRRDEFYEKTRNKYPTILVPRAGDGAANSLTPYRFENDARTAGIMLALDRFSFYEKDYSGHKQFIKEFSRLAKLLVETFPLRGLNRVGWRYINIIPFNREDGIVPLQRFVSIGVSLPEGVSKQFENLSIVFMSKVPDGTITTRIESMIKPDDQQEALLLDFDFTITEKLVLSRISSYVRKAHEQTRALFENLITDDYRQYLRGETI
ncbi:MAG: TIGR04255 family protein [Proteobacteria bacterium]|nr:TIGR04255 family protein [Pseudomonadota bacterium]MCK4486772.1 TIGR04255 family protein [Desulfobacterales bacterium]